MDQEQIFQKLEKLDRAQQRIEQLLSILLERNESKTWLDSYDVKTRFHISKSTLYRLKKDKILKPVFLGKKDLYRRTDVEDVLAKQKTGD